jgi:translation initiation factor RLI1
MVDHEGRLLPDDPEAERKFHFWRATTIAMFLDSLDQKKADLQLKRRTDEYVLRIFNTLRELIKQEEEKGCKDQIATIINQALALDKEINRQTGNVRCIGDIQQAKTVNHAQRVKQDGVVLIPEVLKRGKSTGEGFDQETILVEMEVGYIE